MDVKGTCPSKSQKFDKLYGYINKLAQEVNIFGKIQQGQMGNLDIIKNIE
jgi:hypothetical protein